VQDVSQPTTRELATSLGQSEAEVQAIIQQGQKAKEKMVTANLRLVVSVAKKYQNHNLDFLDLLQEGALGLQKTSPKTIKALLWLVYKTEMQASKTSQSIR
jgi:DNA-directed RNA polymerase sigma subunit (sigma70/sigma32)